MTAVIAVLTGMGCAESSNRSEMAKPKTYTSEDNLIRLEVGMEFTISLDSNPTTGYSWDFSSPLDERLIRLINSSFQPPQTRRKGAGGKQIWTFQTVARGETEIALKYIRPWEKGIPPVNVKNFTVIIEDGRAE